MDKNILTLNTKLMVSTNQSTYFYDSRVEGIDSEHIHISIPTHRGVPLIFRPEQQLIVSALNENGRIIFETSFLKIIYDPIPVAVIKIPKSYKQEQLRQYFRIPSHIYVNLFSGSLEQITAAFNAGESISYERGLIENISGGGCLFLSDGKINLDDVVVLNFRGTAVGDLDLLEATAVRVSTETGGKHYISLEFKNIDEATRNKVIRFIFQKQVELRRMGIHKN